MGGGIRKLCEYRGFRLSDLLSGWVFPAVRHGFPQIPQILSFMLLKSRCGAKIPLLEWADFADNSLLSETNLRNPRIK